MSFKKVKISDLVHLTNGHAFKPEDWGLEGKRIIRIQNLNNPDAPYNLTKKEIDSKFLVSKGDILIAWAGSLGVYEWTQDEPAWLNQHLFRVSFKTAEINKDYFKYVIHQSLIELSQKTRGVGLKHLNKRQIENYEFNLPGVAEQTKSVDILKSIEMIVEKRKKTGRLIEEFLEAKFNESFGDPYFNPNNFPLVKLQDIVKPGKIITYGIVQAGPEEKNGIPYIKSGDIKNGQIIIEKLSRTSKEIASKYARSSCSSGDIVMSIRATVGSVAMLPDELEGANLTQGTARIAVDELVANKYYLLCALSHKGGQAKIRKHEKGLTFKEITLTKLRVVEIPMPPMEVQNRFGELYRAVNSHKISIKRSLTLFKELFQTVLYQTFNVSQTKANDEIDKLLEDDIRIEEFLNSINNSAIESEEEYDTAIKTLYQILERTKSRNEKQVGYMKGIIQRFDGRNIILETNKEYKYRLADETTSTKN